MQNINKTKERFKTLETQMANIATILSQIAQDKFPSQTKPNSKEEIKHSPYIRRDWSERVTKKPPRGS